MMKLILKKPLKCATTIGAILIRSSGIEQTEAEHVLDAYRYRPANHPLAGFVFVDHAPWWCARVLFQPERGCHLALREAELLAGGFELIGRHSVVYGLYAIGKPRSLGQGRNNPYLPWLAGKVAVPAFTNPVPFALAGGAYHLCCENIFRGT